MGSDEVISTKVYQSFLKAEGQVRNLSYNPILAIPSFYLHHIDGDNTNNKLENLQILCPNCHTMTDNYRGKNIGKTKIIECVSDTTTTCTLETY